MKPSAGCLIPKTSAEDLYPDSNPGAYIKILGRKFESLAESFRFAAGYLKLRYQTGCSNQPRYFHVFLPRCYATLLFLLHILQLFTQFYSIKHMVTYQFQIIYRLCYSEFFFWVKSGTNAKSLLYFQRTAKNRELILFDIEDMLSSGNWGKSRSKTLPITWEEERHFWSKQQGNRNSKLYRRRTTENQKDHWKYLETV